MEKRFNKNSTTAEYGNSNEAVSALQSQLNSQGANLKVDGKYGDLTKAAVEKYGTPKTNTTLNSNAIAPVVETPLPERTVSTYGGLNGVTEAIVSQSKENQKIEQPQPSAQDNYLKAIMQGADIAFSEDRSAEDKLLSQYNNFTSQLEQEQLANRRRVEAVQKSFTGTTAGASDKIDSITRNSLSKQADIAILQMNASRNYNAAKSIADRAVEMKLEKYKSNLEALKLLDSREYGDIQAKKEREYKALERNENAISQLKLNVAQYGGGADILSKLSAIDTTKPDAYDKAVAIAGKYATDPLDRAIKQAQLNKLNADIASTQVSSNDANIKTMGDLFKNPKLKTNEQIQNAGAVLSAITDFGSKTNIGKVKGYGFLGGGFLPEALSSQKAIATRANIAGIEGKLQQWLSGASLSKGQEKLVAKMIPESNDTDETVKTKLNQLANYMISDVKGRAFTQGVTLDIPPVDVFGKESVDVESSYLDSVSKTLNDPSSSYLQAGYDVN